MEIEEVEAEVPPISRLEAQRAVTIARRYVEQNSGDPAVLRLTDALDDYFYDERRKRQMQPQITNFFKSNR